MQTQNNLIIIGLDLSFNSSGIVISNTKNISFNRVVYNESINNSKKYIIPNVFTQYYRMPENITVDDLLIQNHSSNDLNNKQQLHSTLRALMCSKRICNIIDSYLKTNKIESGTIIVSIENYIMPSFGGQNSLKNVSGLIALQSYIREYFVKLQISLNKLKKDIQIKMFTPTPSQNKKFFTGNGSADKKDMIEIFQTKYDGNKLLPDLSHGKVDDIIDAFALMYHGYIEFINKK